MRENPKQILYHIKIIKNEKNDKVWKKWGRKQTHENTGNLWIEEEAKQKTGFEIHEIWNEAEKSA